MLVLHAPAARDYLEAYLREIYPLHDRLNQPTSGQSCQERRRAMQKKEAKRRVTAAQLWLHYFNQTLREQNIISEQEYLRMASLIRARYPGGEKTG